MTKMYFLSSCGIAVAVVLVASLPSFSSAVSDHVPIGLNTSSHDSVAQTKRTPVQLLKREAPQRRDITPKRQRTSQSTLASNLVTEKVVKDTVQLWLEGRSIRALNQLKSWAFVHHNIPAQVALGKAYIAKRERKKAREVLEMASANGSLEGKFELSVLERIEKNCEKTIALRRELIDQGYVPAATWLASLYLSSEEKFQDYAEAKRLLDFAATHGDVDAFPLLGQYFDIHKDFVSAAYYYLVAVNHGDLKNAENQEQRDNILFALKRLVEIHTFLPFGDFRVALSCLAMRLEATSAFVTGHAARFRPFGGPEVEVFDFTHGTLNDILFRLYQKYCAHDLTALSPAELENVVKSITTIVSVLAPAGLTYWQPVLFADSDVEIYYDGYLAPWLLFAADFGSIDALIVLGVITGYGKTIPRWGLEKDQIRSFYYFQKAAEQGSIVAKIFLARHYADGLGVAIDEAHAVRLYQEVLEQAMLVPQPWKFLLDEAAYRLALHYLSGRGIAQNYQKSLDCFAQIGLFLPSTTSAFGASAQSMTKRIAQWTKNLLPDPPAVSGPSTAVTSAPAVTPQPPVAALADADHAYLGEVYFNLFDLCEDEITLSGALTNYGKALDYYNSNVSNRTVGIPEKIASSILSNQNVIASAIKYQLNAQLMLVVTSLMRALDDAPRLDKIFHLGKAIAYDPQDGILASSFDFNEKVKLLFYFMQSSLRYFELFPNASRSNIPLEIMGVLKTTEGFIERVNVLFGFHAIRFIDQLITVCTSHGGPGLSSSDEAFLLAAKSAADFNNPITTDTGVKMSLLVDRIAALLYQVACSSTIDFEALAKTVLKDKPYLVQASTMEDLVNRFNDLMKKYNIANSHLSLSYAKEAAAPVITPHSVPSSSQSGTLSATSSSNSAAPDSGLRYIKFNKFDEANLALVKPQILEALDANASIIFDLRDNSGGYHHVLQTLLSYFLENGTEYGKVVVKNDTAPGLSIHFKEYDTISVVDQFTQTNRQKYKKMRCVITSSYLPQGYTGKIAFWVGGNTACAAEIFANTLQRIKGATIFGTPTRGATMLARAYDIGFGLTLNQPKSDFYDLHNRKMEGASVRIDRYVWRAKDFQPATELWLRGFPADSGATSSIAGTYDSDDEVYSH